MAFNFVVEDGSADSDANSYCTVEFAADWIAANAYQSEAWDALTLDQQEKYLVRASQMLDVRFRWNGTRYDPDSGLKWPRCDVIDEDGFIIPSDVIPAALQQAAAEFATYLIGEDWTVERDADQYRELRIDVVDVKYNTDYRRAYIPDTIIYMLEGLGFAQSGRKPMFKPVIRH